MNLDVDGRTYIVSGASSGIGLATAGRLLREGARVCGFSRDLDRLRDAYAAWHRLAPERLLLQSGDARDRSDVVSIVDAAAREFGGIHGVVAGAGTGLTAGVGADPAVWSDQFDMKVGAAITLVEAARPRLWPGSAIVLVNGVTAHHPNPELAPVSAARAALASYAANLSTEVARAGIRVVVVNVGVVSTARQREKYERSGAAMSYEDWCRTEALRRAIPLRRMGRPEEVGDTIAFLLSDRSSYTTGTSIDVSGGLDGRA